MSQLVYFVGDLVAICVLAFGIYFPRHHRRDLVLAFLGVNVGVLAVVGALSGSTVGAGLGLGLFGVLSIIRLRSTELNQREVAYYFAALALGILGGLGAPLGWSGLALMALVLGVILVADSPRLFARYHFQTMVLDRAFTDHAVMVEYLGDVLNARICSATIIRVDLANETTLVEVRYAVDEMANVRGTSSFEVAR